MKVWKTYLVQRVEPFRLERFNVGIFALDPATQEFTSRFLSDGQWEDRFGSEGRLVPDSSLNNWKAWCAYFNRLGWKDILTPPMARASPYQIIPDAEPLSLGMSKAHNMEDYADRMFAELVL